MKKVLIIGGTLHFELEGTGDTLTSILMTGPAELVKEYEI